MHKSTGIFVCALFALGLAGCGKEESSGAAPAVTAPVTNAANHAMDAASDAADKAGDAMDDAMDDASDAMDEMGDAAGEAMDEASDAASDAADAAGEAADDAVDAAGEAVDDAVDAGEAAAEEARKNAAESMKDMTAIALEASAAFCSRGRRKLLTLALIHPREWIRRHGARPWCR